VRFLGGGSRAEKFSGYAEKFFSTRSQDLAALGKKAPRYARRN
jgi:hypothetical protein